MNETVVCVCVFCHVGSMVHSMAWNDAANILCGIQDNQLTVWYYPSAVFTDKELLPKTLYIKDGRYPIRVLCTHLHTGIVALTADTVHQSDGWVTVTEAAGYVKIRIWPELEASTNKECKRALMIFM